MTTLYLAGSLFNAGERMHNALLERELKKYGYEIILPQREALKFGGDSDPDIEAIAEDCRTQCTRPDVIYVGCADGADVDSGTCFELGAAHTANGRALIYRTDFRTAEDREVGVNAMLRVGGVKYIYLPCFATNIDELLAFYVLLAKKIDEELRFI